MVDSTSTSVVADIMSHYCFRTLKTPRIFVPLSQERAMDVSFRRTRTGRCGPWPTR